MTMIEIDPEAITPTDRYKLMIGSVLPRPIAFVSTLSATGVPNLAPFSFFTVISANPLSICFSPMIRSSDGQKKDTLKNIEATGEFVVHVVTEALAEPMNLTAGEYLAETNEFEIAGLTPLPSKMVKPFRVAESPIQLECKLAQIVTLGESVGGGSLVIGKVVYMHFSPNVYENGKIITSKLKPIGRLAGTEYVKMTDVFSLTRPT